MPPVLAALVASFVANPDSLIKLLPLAVALLEAMPDVFIGLLPEGPAKEHAKANQAQVVSTLKALVGILVEHPELVKALVAQFGRR